MDNATEWVTGEEFETVASALRDRIAENGHAPPSDALVRELVRYAGKMTAAYAGTPFQISVVGNALALADALFPAPKIDVFTDLAGKLLQTNAMKCFTVGPDIPQRDPYRPEPPRKRRVKR